MASFFRVFSTVLFGFFLTLLFWLVITVLLFGLFVLLADPRLTESIGTLLTYGSPTLALLLAFAVSFKLHHTLHQRRWPFITLLIISGILIVLGVFLGGSSLAALESPQQIQGGAIAVTSLARSLYLMLAAASAIALVLGIFCFLCGASGLVAQRLTPQPSPPPQTTSPTPLGWTSPVMSPPPPPTATTRQVAMQRPADPLKANQEKGLEQAEDDALAGTGKTREKSSAKSPESGQFD